jgi:hypothetical protein
VLYLHPGSQQSSFHPFPVHSTNKAPCIPLDFIPLQKYSGRTMGYEKNTCSRACIEKRETIKKHNPSLEIIKKEKNRAKGVISPIHHIHTHAHLDQVV